MSCRTWPPDEPPPPPPPPPKPPPDPGQPPKFFYSISYYGALTAPNDSVWKEDFNQLVQRGIRNVRIWVDWPATWAPNGRCIAPDGSLIPDKVQLFQRILTGAAARGIKVDMTFGGPGSNNDGYEGNRIDSWQRGIRNMASVFKDWTLFYPVDVHNEVHAGIGKTGGELTYAHVASATQQAAAIAPGWSLTASTDGDSGTVALDYAQMIALGAVIHVCAPHYPRDEGWGGKVESRVKNTRAVLYNNFLIIRPIYLQEENLYLPGYPGAENWSVEQSTAAATGARRSAAVGYCFHTHAGFDLNHGTMFEQLSPGELEAINALPRGGLTP